MKLKGKIAIINGATSGMGKAIAERFVHEGASVILSGRDEQRGKELESNLGKNGGNAFFISGDISLESTNRKLVEEAIGKFGKLDIVVTNAGKLGLGSATRGLSTMPQGKRGRLPSLTSRRTCGLGSVCQRAKVSNVS